MGVLSAEDDAACSRMERDLDSLTNEIKRMERRDAIDCIIRLPGNLFFGTSIATCIMVLKKCKDIILPGISYMGSIAGIHHLIDPCVKVSEKMVYDTQRIHDSAILFLMFAFILLCIT